MSDPMTRRTLLLSVPMVAAASRLPGQSPRPTLRVRALNHIAIAVSDKKRSMQFYQGLFGWPIQHTQGTTTGLRIGAGPQYVTMSQGKPGFGHWCLTVEGFGVDRIMPVLARHGVARTENSQLGPLTAWVRMRGEANGGAKEGTPEIYVNDPDGIRLQIQDVRYCGGPGVFGDGCPSVPPLKRVLVVRDFQSFTLSVSSQERSLAFYQSLFGMAINGRDGTAPMLDVGSGPQRIVIDASGTAGATPRVEHVTLVMDGFEADKVQKALSVFGVKPRGDTTGTPGPLVSWVRTRSVFFTDPDGIVIQLQRSS